MLEITVKTNDREFILRDACAGEDSTHADLCEKFEGILRSMGYVFDGHLRIVED